MDSVIGWLELEAGPWPVIGGIVVAGLVFVGLAYRAYDSNEQKMSGAVAVCIVIALVCFGTAATNYSAAQKVCTSWYENGNYAQFGIHHCSNIVHCSPSGSYVKATCY